MAFTVTDNTGTLAALARLYEIVYAREADGNGLAYWAEAIDAGTVTLAGVAKTMLERREAAATLSDAQDPLTLATVLAERAFGREGTEDEIADILALLEGGEGRGAAIAEIAQWGAAEAHLDVVGETGLEIADWEQAVFRFGVASGDPDAGSVVLWTHVTSETDGPVEVTWEVSTTADFSDVVASGTATAQPDDDYTVKVIADGLEAGGEYFYRFTAEGETSRIGETSTLPEGSLDQLVMAVFSCANFPAGYFNAYAAAADRDFDVSVHLGDYIYEYGADGYASDQAGALGRYSSPPTEILTAADYSLRYQQYTRDTDLQDVRATAPIIMMWDDHETANDSWAGGAENHDPATEGGWEERRDTALEAYYNWNPIREPASGDPLDADRSFDFGDLASLHMLETRLQARDLQLDYARDITARIGEYLADETGATFAGDVAMFPELVPEGLDPADPATLAELAGDEAFVQALALSTVLAEAEFGDRSMIGDGQLAEVSGRIAESGATWQIIGSQTLMQSMTLPAPILLDPATLPAYLAIAGKQLQGVPLTAEEEALLAQPAIPYNLDAWDGYGADREALFQALVAADANAIVLAGDTHNAWFSELTTRDGTRVAYEIGGPGVSSPGLEDFLAGVDPALVAQVFTDNVDGLTYANTADRGYVEVVVTPEAVTSTYVYVDTVDRLAFATVEHTETVTPDLFG